VGRGDVRCVAVAEHVGVAPDQLLRQRPGHPIEVEPTPPPGHLCLEDHLQQHIPELLPDGVGIIPIDRKKTRREDGKHPLEPISDVIREGGIVLLFPEGTRGEPEQMDVFQTGVAHLARRHPDVPITPVFMHGLGKALPKGEAILVPFFCDMFVGEAIELGLGKQEFMSRLGESMDRLKAEMPSGSWV